MMTHAGKLRNLLQKRIVFLDGGIGTELIKRGMPSGVAAEEWAASNTEILKAIHSDYAEAGADIVLTCTFGGTNAKLRTPDIVRDLNHGLAEAALDAVGGRALVAASIGPTGKLIHPSGTMTWKETYRLFTAQAEALADTGIDIFFLETFSDPRELKAAVLAIRDNVPDAFISAQMTFGNGGLSLSGTSPTALVVLANQLPVDAVGSNCGTGPVELLPIIQEMVRFSSKWISVEPNAGLPVDGVYEMTPDKFAGWLEDFARSGAAIIGGCCGSGPAHVREYVSLLENRPVVELHTETLQLLTSVDRMVTIGDKMLTVGESINPTGKKNLQNFLSKGDFFSVISLARAQGRADLIDVNLGLERLLPDGFVHEVFSRLSIGSPLSVDLSDPGNIETAFCEIGGIGILNSLISTKKYIDERIDTLLRHGGYAVLLPIDENGPGRTAEERLKKLEKGIALLRSHGFPENRIIADPIVKPLGTGADSRLILDTLRLFRQKGLLTIAGISNVSYGLPDRSALNAALLASLGSSGLDMAIVDVLDSKVLEMHRNTQILMGNIDPVERRLPELDPQGISPDFMGILVKSIIIGDRRQTEATGRELLESGRTAREILEEGLSPAMKKVGDLYNRKKLFLPHLIASAGASEVLTKLIRPYLDKEKVSSCKGRIVLASVRGDIHDIGKNLVAIFLRNAGFEVFDLGKDVHADEIVTKAAETNADIIALSALMSTTAPEMEKVISLAKSQGVSARIMVGGAVLTKDYADSIGADGYAANAYSAVQTASSLMRKDKS
ncbi:MAG: homocysteine S-methyltransferase family protein [Candidatus Aegiribacteria sp.]|nr:homocysteine S-methyltransferase family protein [Candidatus Aegiribacteria sp.]